MPRDLRASEMIIGILTVAAIAGVVIHVDDNRAVAPKKPAEVTVVQTPDASSATTTATSPQTWGASESATAAGPAASQVSSSPAPVALTATPADPPEPPAPEGPIERSRPMPAGIVPFDGKPFVMTE